MGDSWTAGEAQIVVGLSRFPMSLTRLIGELDALNADIALHDDLELALRRLIAAEYVSVSSRGFRLSKSGRRVRRSGVKGIRRHGSRVLYQGVMRELAAAGEPPTPASWELSTKDYDEAVAAYHARMQPLRTKLRRRRQGSSGQRA